MTAENFFFPDVHFFIFIKTRSPVKKVKLISALKFQQAAKILVLITESNVEDYLITMNLPLHDAFEDVFVKITVYEPPFNIVISIGTGSP